MPKSEQKRILIQLKVKPAVLDFINAKVKAGGYTSRRYYLFDLLKRDGMDISMSDL